MTSVEEQATPPTSTPWVPVWGGAGLAYKGDWAAGTFVDGDVVVKDGIAYLCVGGPTALAPDPAPWGNAAVSLIGDELAYTELTGGVPITATTRASAVDVLPAQSVTVDGTTPIMVEFFAPIFQGPAATNWIYLNLWIDGVDVGSIAQHYAAASSTLPIFVARRLMPAAGTHTFQFKVWGAASGGQVLGGTGAPAAANTPAFARITRVVPSPPTISPGSVTPVTYGVNLPSSPADGQEAILVDSLTAPTYQWRFRYVAGISDAYKWVFIGGSAFTHSIPTNEASSGGSNNAWVNLATLGPRMVVPRAGIYEAAYGSEVSCGAASAWVSAAVGAGDFAGGGQVHQAEQPIGSSGWWGSVAGAGDVTVAAGGEIRVKYGQWTALACNWRYRYLTVRPKRVA